MGSSRYIYFVMGVSGCGKSTIGKALSAALSVPFFDGDDFHPPENVEKMRRGIPLQDSDRLGWLRALNSLAREHGNSGAVIACSALKQAYRDLLETGLESRVVWVYLKGTQGVILKRMQNRKGHYMPESLLDSQFAALEPPSYGIHIPVELTVEQAVSKVLQHAPQ